MDFLSRFFFNRIQWRFKKVCFENVRDKHLMRLLVSKGIVVVDCREKADLVIVDHHPSCWWSWKEITFADLYYLLSDADKCLYYIMRIKNQYRPALDETVFFIHNYMVVMNNTRKVISVYYQQDIPFIDQKIYTKKIILDQHYVHAWISGYHHTTGHSADGLMLQLFHDKYLSIRDAICIFEHDATSSQSMTPSSTSFLFHSKFNLSKLFQKKHMWCRILHHD